LRAEPAAKLEGKLFRPLVTQPLIFSSFLALDWHGSATSSLAELSYALHQQLAQELNGETVYGYRKLTSLNVRARASNSQEKPSANPALADSDLEFRPKPPSQGLIQTQWLEGPTIESVGIVAGEDTTAQVHPELFTKTLFEKARARGVEYLKGWPRSWDEQSNGSKTLSVDASDGPKEIPVDTLILTAGPWTGRVAKQLLDLDIPISNLPGHSILIRPSEPLPAHAVFASVYGAAGVTGSPELFVRPDGLVYFAGENTGALLPEGTADVKLNPDAIQKLVKSSSIISDSLANGKIEVEQVGL
jgi:glycine/D-amino acid oxidase-like deaminating enzyme